MAKGLKAAVIEKVQAADDRTGHFGRNAVGLGGVTPARWGVFVDGKQVGLILHHVGFWEIYRIGGLGRLAPKAFRSRKAACSWALENIK